MKPKLKLKFTDFWKRFNPNSNIFITMLSPFYDIELSDEPDVLIYSVFDFDFLNYNCPKIYYTSENTRPNFRECDFAVSYDYGSFKGRNLRIPSYRGLGNLETLTEIKDPEAIFRNKRKFACTVVSNGNCKERNLFYDLLNKYKKVDSGGRYLNNVGGPVEDKYEFIKNYKFVFAFENSSYPGYTTEKIVEPMLVNSVPIYWGNTLIEKEFNPKSFINVHDYDSFEKAIESIIQIDRDDSLYMKYLSEPYFYNNHFPDELNFEVLGRKLHHVVQRLLNNKPKSKKLFYNQVMKINKFRRKVLQRIYKKPHFYF